MYRFAILLAVTLPAAAADPKPFDAAATAKAIAPLVDSQTLAIAHIRVGRLTPAAVERLAGLLALDKDARKGVLDKLDGWKTNLERAGIDDLFFVLSSADWTAPVALVVPAGTVDPKEVGRLLGAIYPGAHTGIETGAKDGAFLAGTKAMVEHLKSLTPENRPDLAAAFAAAGDTDVQIVVVPSKDHRRVVEELMPTLPKEFGGGSVKVVTAGLRWVALGADLGDKPSLSLTAQARDAATAKSLADLHGKAVDAVSLVQMGDGRTVADWVGTEFAPLRAALNPEVKGDQVVVRATDETVGGGLAKLAARATEAATNNRKMETMKHIAIAMHNYLSTYGQFPGRAGYSLAEFEKKPGKDVWDLTMKPRKDSKPVLSWRVYLLPYIDEDNLFREFHLNEPWDSDHNKKLIPRLPKMYQSSNASLDKAGKTRYVGPVGKGLMFEPDGPGVRIADVTDGTANTILFVEAAEAGAVVWTKPDDLVVDAKDPKKGLFDPEGMVVLTAFADGSVRALPKKIDAMNLWHMFTRNGGEVVDLP